MLNIIKTSAEAAYQAGLAARQQSQYPDAIQCFLFAANQNHKEAQIALGWAYTEGQGVGKTLNRAVNIMSLQKRQIIQ